ncbi:hypothetical protein PVK06_041619 [Gossypium arboreum]|uniref:DUF4283 domain-containing protein n=1 Tax=Gossypium arboreum TaxID=29729 RepID=A0ABR0N8Q8_GOSAR|nr:hypothetical protein PVK06_041619 [Gossypium arboreum]
MVLFERFFIKIEPWSEKLKIIERVAWIEVAGVPLYCWNFETFKCIAGLWGKLVSVGENLTKIHNFKKLELLISTSQSNMVDELVSLEVGDVLFLIRVKEWGLWEWKDDCSISKDRWKKMKMIACRSQNRWREQGRRTFRRAEKASWQVH